MVQSTTKRYSAVKNNIDILKISENDLYQFGCEFEFYIDTENKQKLINEHKQLIKSIDNDTKEEFLQAVSEAGLIE